MWLYRGIVDRNCSLLVSCINPMRAALATCVDVTSIIAVGKISNSTYAERLVHKACASLEHHEE